MPLVPKNDDRNRSAVSMTPFSFNVDFEPAHKGYLGTANALSTTNIDFAIGAEDRYLHGINLKLVNQLAADTLKLRVVDVNGIMSPAGTVLKQPVDTWNVNADVSDQGQNNSKFLSKIPAGLFVRVVYTATGLLSVQVKLNLFMQRKLISSADMPTVG